MKHHTTINGESTGNNHSHRHNHNHNHNHSHSHNERRHRHRRHPQRRNNHSPHDRRHGHHGRHGVTPHHPTVAIAIWLLVRGGGTDAIGREPHPLGSSGRGSRGGRGRPSTSSSSSSGRPRSDVALRDSFPCEADSLTAIATGAAVSASAGDSGSGNGNGTAGGGNGPNASHAGHSHASHGGNTSVTSGDFPSFFPVSPRGGAVDAARKDVGGEADLDLSNVWNDDDYLDDMVDALIAGLEESDATKGAAEGVKEGSVSILEESDQDSDADCPDPVDESEEESLDQSTTATMIESEGSVDEQVELELELESEAEDDTVSDSNKPTQDSDTLSRQLPVPPSSSPPTTKTTTTTKTTKTTTVTSSPPPPTTPTNAYYRFLLRRGPKFHILASFSLLLTQWIYVYLPLLYRPIASLLLSCRIYDPNALWERDRQSAAFISVRDRRRRTQDGIHARLKDKLWVSDANYGAFLSTSSAKRTGGTKKARKQMQKREDEEAAVKLKRLYRLSGAARRMPTSLADVRYRYLSVGFRKRHHLGREYRVETPKRFMGETMEGSELGEDEAVLSDVEDEMDTKSMESSSKSQSKKGMTSQQQRHVTSQPPTQLRGQQQQQHRRIKRKRINDWVVQSFAVHRGPPATNVNVNVNATNTKEIPLTLWNAVLGSPPPSSSASSSSASSSNDANSILRAAWESRRAEQAIFWQTGRSADNDNNDHVHGDGNAKEASSKRSGFDPETGVDGTPRDDDSKNGRMGSGSSTAGTHSTASYSGSKMFQSVMSRVGSNGRILGAYPMDAPPIEECAHERGVLHLARRYGYGDWSRQDVAFDFDDDVGGDDDDSWGGGDLFSDPDADKEDEELEAEVLNAGLSSREKNTSNTITSGNRKRRTRRKKRPRSSSPSSSSQRAKALGMSGGGGGSFSVETAKKNNPRVTFEFGVSSSTKRSTTKNSVPTTGQRKPSFVSSSTSTPSSSKQNNERNAHEIRSQLHRRNPTMFASDIKIKAPMQVINESKRRRKQHEE